jgi:hypothetical protein
MKILRNDARIDEATEIRVSTTEQPELFVFLTTCTHSQWYEKQDWTRRFEDDGHTVVIKMNHKSFGNDRLTIELSGMELAIIAEMLCPHADSQLQCKLYEQICNAVGSNLFNFVRTPLRNAARNDCVRHCGRDTNTEGIAITKGCLYDIRSE